ESVEVRVHLRSEESHARTITLSGPGGNRASRETARWTKPRRGERTGVSESIEVHVIAIPKESNAHYVTQNRSGRESSESGDREMDKARRANERERVGQSKFAFTSVQKSLMRVRSR